MAQTVTFDADAKRGLLERCATSERPLMVRVRPTDLAADAAEVIELYVHAGDLYVVRTRAWTGVDAMLWVALTRTGTLEVITLPAPIKGASRAFGDAYDEAEVAARAYLDLVAPLGGIGARLVANAARLAEVIGNIPDAANGVLKLLDETRTIAAVTQAAGHECALTARILRRLFDLGVVERHDPLLPAPTRKSDKPSRAVRPVPSQWAPPAEGWGESSELPSTEEVEDEEVGGWLAAEDAPPPLLSDDAFTDAFAAMDPTNPASEPSAAQADRSPSSSSAPLVARATGDVPPSRSSTARPEPRGSVDVPPSRTSSAPHDDAIAPDDPTPEPVVPIDPTHPARMRAKVPLTTRRPGPADEDVFREAGVGDSKTPIVVLAIAALLIVAVVWSLRGDDEEVMPPRDAGVAPPPALVVSTTTTATTAEAFDDTSRATIAAPDAPEDVKRAERLLDAGRYREAGALLEQLRTSRPDDAAVFILSGQVYVDSGRLAPAQTMADRALELEPNSYRAWVLLGSIAQFRGNSAEAIRAYERAAKLGPNHPMAPEIDSVVEQLRRRSR